MPRSREEIVDLQRTLNRFTERYLYNYPKLIVDGINGAATKRRIQTVKWYLGYGKERTSKVESITVRRIRHPRSPRYLTPAMIARGIYRRRKQKRDAKRHEREAKHPTRGVSTFDGRPVAAWLKPYLEWARDHGWRGTLNSGWRDPAYSEHLCYQMCGAPSCPGRCAGRNSNHSGNVKPAGAIDVSDYGTFGSLMRSCPYEPRIFNALGAADPVHFSASGR